MHELLSVKLRPMIQASFGETIRYQRKELGLTQEALSLKSGVTFRYLQDLEAGNKQPTITTVFKLANALELSPGALLDDIFENWRNSLEAN